jgi:ubiquinone/menaquinone biosynthesis C-methylase UbiE
LTVGLDEARLKSLAIWDEMSAGWQKYNDYLWNVSRRVGENMVEGLDPQPGQTILDIASGPGDTGFVAAKLIGDEGKLISTDFSPAMVEVARKRGESLGITNAEHRVMDAERMDLPDDSVDGALCRWGFMLMLDPEAALKECRRVIKDGGKLSFSVWGTAQDNPWVTVFAMAMVQIGHVPQKDPYGAGGIFSMADNDRIGKLVEGAGFGDVRIEEVDVLWEFDNFDAAWSYANELAGAIAAVLKTLPPDEVESYKTVLKGSMEGFRDGDRYALPGRTINVVAS